MSNPDVEVIGKVEEKKDEEEEPDVQHQIMQHMFQVLKIGPSSSSQRPGGTNNNNNPMVDVKFPGKHPDRMELSQQERNWALAIKEAILEDPELKEKNAAAANNCVLSDFMIAQIALLDHDNLDAAVERAQLLCSAKEEFHIIDDIPQGMQMIRAHMRFMQYLAFEFQESTECFIWGADATSCVEPFENNPEKLHQWMTGFYYIFQALQCDFTAVRNGTIHLIEAGGFALISGGGMSPKQYRILYDQMASFYPRKTKLNKYVNAPTAYHILLSLSKPFMPRSDYQTNEFTRTEMRLDRFLWLGGGKEMAENRMHSNLKKYLTIRYENEKSFSL